ncbi:hypothetical protein [Polyangium spumosum]|uniref:Uncharacterized protein n=1 Tax=Polyangium spumosum TaxID=889282 RepID=A0A6N7PYQ9_9BACT|nr:hypothetical protein [Polyangium spumosum]MRG97218.1 hypothetical protein [Polyangium spumosum]
MRTLFRSIASLLVMVVAGCNTVDPDECWVNTSGGFEDEQPIPIGSGVGATTGGDFLTPPGGEPLAAEATENPCVAMGSVTVVRFSPSEFPFVTIVPDDGMGLAGGWQEAKANLEFIKKRRSGSSTWICPLTIGMPLRPEKMGMISASLAATMSVNVTEEVAYGMDFNLPPGIFCDTFRTKVKATFKSMYPNLGATVKL